MLKELAAALAPRARRGLLAGAVLVLAAAAAGAAWLLRTDYHVLFADLRPQDAAAMVAELDRQKIDYRLAEGGTAILVDAAAVHATRLKLMGKEVPLHGAAGFELFNGGDFGMTEFAQKVNYQRALQGELTRTILSLAEVRDARVHLALPEEGLFKRAASKPKAAITLALKPGESLRPDQVAGIQRLVAGAVPGMSIQDVTLVDQRGVAVTRGAAEADPQQGGSGRLDLKRETERLLAQKATEVLERAFGAGLALASVDVALNMDQVRVTTEDVIGAPAAAGQQPGGVVVREREVVRDTPAAQAATGEAPARSGALQREVEYQVGRRVEHVITQPGAVRRIQVAAVVRSSLDAGQLEQARVLVAAAVGAVPERGDTIVVQAVSAATRPELPGRPAPVAPVPLLPSAAGVGEAPAPWAGAALAGLMLAVWAALWWSRRRRRREPIPLVEAERQVLATQLRLWLEQPAEGSGKQRDATVRREAP